jgi:hypothetical protein
MLLVQRIITTHAFQPSLSKNVTGSTVLLAVITTHTTQEQERITTGYASA